MAGNIAGVLLKVVGWIAVLISLIFFIMSISEGIDGIAVACILIFLLPGIALVVYGGKLRKSAKIKKYINLVITQEITAIDDIAAVFPNTHDRVRTDLQEMIDEGYFPNAHIDDLSNTIILPQRKEYQPTDIEEEKINDKEEKPGQTKCSSCGAVVSAAAVKKGECEYCGSAF